MEEKKGETKRLQEAITQLDNDTKHYHKQFTINRDNCEKFVLYCYHINIDNALALRNASATFLKMMLCITFA